MHLQLNEHFWSIQGEGAHAGRTAVFLRLQGCPVGCSWCDSKLTWYAGGERVAVEAIPEIVSVYPESELIVITGGEPLIYDLDPLLETLRRHFPQRSLHLETSGAFPYKGVERPNWTTLSPKYPVDFDVAPNVLLAASELKYVVDEHFTPEIVQRHEQELAALGRPLPPVCLMPEGCPPLAETVERTMQLLRRHPTWRFGPRLQYSHTAIAEGEGRNNQQVTSEDARAAAHRHRHEREASPREPARH
ncbi:MAG: 7-carboxy-7-deazaguanine synthase QueE [Chloroflexi bacterium]|nr:MAG: 7-carboxy-7-deazaguanine synthase QueE [Chloroflexota bacterium]